MWKDIPGWPGYQAETKLGLVRNRYGRVLAIRFAGGTSFQRSNAYPRVELHPHPNGGGKKGLKVPLTHLVLAAEGFRLPGKGYEACHRDGDKFNNSIDNLYWGTKADNLADAKWHKLNPGIPRPDAPLLGAYGARTGGK